MARTIGKKNIALVKRLMVEAFSKGVVGGQAIEEYVHANLPDEVYDTWEDAYNEINRIVGDNYMPMLDKSRLMRNPRITQDYVESVKSQLDNDNDAIHLGGVPTTAGGLDYWYHPNFRGKGPGVWEVGMADNYSGDDKPVLTFIALDEIIKGGDGVLFARLIDAGIISAPKPNPGFQFTTQSQVRDAFWQMLEEVSPNLAAQWRPRKRQNDYIADIRMAWVDFVDSLARDEVISESLAFRVTL